MEDRNTEDYGKLLRELLEQKQYTKLDPSQRHSGGCIREPGDRGAAVHHSVPFR